MRLAGGSQRIPQLERPGVVDEDLETVLAGVTGPGDERRYARDATLADRVVAQRAEIHIREWLDDVDGSRTLDGAQGHRQRAIVQNGPEPREALDEGVAHDMSIRGIGDDEEPLLGEPVDDEVVDDPAVLGADHRVVGPANGEGRWIADERRGKARAGLGALDEQLTHVREIEQAGSFANRPVLIEDAAVLDRHEPAAEFDQPRPERDVPVVERRLVIRRLGLIGHVMPRAVPSPCELRPHSTAPPRSSSFRRRQPRSIRLGHAGRVLAPFRRSAGGPRRRS